MLTTIRARSKQIALTMILAFAIAGLAWHLANAQSPSLRHRFVVGQRLTYRLEYVSASASNLAGLTQEVAEKSGQAIYTSVEADLHATVVDVTADGAWIACSIPGANVQMAMDGELAIEQTDSIRADLGRGFLLFVETNGRFQKVHFDSRVNSLTHGFARALLAMTQVVLPADENQNEWDAREEDPNGPYDVRYRRHAGNALSGAVATLTKERTRYLPAPRAQSIRALNLDTVARSAGELRVRFDKSAGRVEAIEGQEATTFHVNGKTIARAETTMRMTFVRAETLSASDQKALAAACSALKSEPGFALSAVASTAKQSAAIYRNELGGASVDGVLKELAHFDARADENSSDTKLYFKLKALVYLHPEACPQLGKALAAARTGSRSAQLLTDALSSIGHAEAQSALIAATRSKSEDLAALAQLTPALAMVEAPTQSAEDLLRELSASSPHSAIRQSADLGLGTMAYHLSGASPTRATKITRTMADKLKAATSPEARRHLLLVLGNAGVHETLDDIVPHLKDSVPEVRAAASAALRWIQSANVDVLLCDVLANDAEAAVRLEAVTALGFRTMTSVTFTAQKNALQKDASSSVRVASLQNLVRAQSAFPEARDLLTQAANAACESLRDEARSLLAIE